MRLIGKLRIELVVEHTARKGGGEEGREHEDEGGRVAMGVKYW